MGFYLHFDNDSLAKSNLTEQEKTLGIAVAIDFVFHNKRHASIEHAPF